MVTSALSPSRPAWRGPFTLFLAVACLAVAAAAIPPAANESWNDDKLVAAYTELKSQGRLEAAVKSPALPDHPAQQSFLEALAWFAAGTPNKAGALSLEQLDGFLQGQVENYLQLLTDKVEQGTANDYNRTRTWKVVQKLTILREEMLRSRKRDYPYPAMKKVPGEDDAWERKHTLRSPEEFGEKVCRDSHERPVLVKFGNTNCTQCMLFEMIGSVREFAERPDTRGTVDVYKIWWGLQPDASFSGIIRDPERLDDLVKAEGVRSSPTFVVYRNGRRYPCAEAFPDAKGADENLKACLQQEFGEAPLASVCELRGAPANQSAQ